jgi:crotonobetainyl-CoA:carnitine CoA-transferase CaiB-like acyl-CoA transferase
MDVLEQLWVKELGGDAAWLQRVTLTGQEPGLPSSFRVGAMAQAAIAASSLAAASLWLLRTGRYQTVSVDMLHACMEFRSERYLQIVDRSPSSSGSSSTNGGGDGGAAVWDKIAGLYATGDGQWVRIHTNFPHHRDGILRLLGCEYSRESVQAALRAWTGQEFEDKAAAAGLVATLCRTPEQWQAHEQAKAIAPLPLVDIQRVEAWEAHVHDQPHAPLPLPGLSPQQQQEAQPLSGIRVLDLTRIIAGPVAARTLAAHGADVLTTPARICRPFRRSSWTWAAASSRPTST